jgi:hypothetical protein
MPLSARRFFQFLCLLALTLALALTGLPARAQQAVSEYSMKAVLLFRLPQFVYWPDNDGQAPRLMLCLAGENPFGNALDRLARERVGGRPVEIVQLAALGDDIQCDYIFISRSESAAVDALLRKLAGRRTVTVSDIPGFARAGGMVELTLSDGRVGVALNRRAAQRQGLEFSAQLLRLAKVVEP